MKPHRLLFPRDVRYFVSRTYLEALPNHMCKSKSIVHLAKQILCFLYQQFINATGITQIVENLRTVYLMNVFPYQVLKRDDGNCVRTSSILLRNNMLQCLLHHSCFRLDY